MTNEELDRIVKAAKTNQTSAHPTIPTISNEDIKQTVKSAICAKLKCPSSAQFPEDLMTISGNPMHGYHVDGYVDSQNSYGAMVRSDYSVEIKVVNNKPVVISSSVERKVRAQRTGAIISNTIIWYIVFTILGVLGFAIFGSIYDLF